MPSKAHKIRLIESLETRLANIRYGDYEALDKLCTEIRIVIRRIYGESSVYWHDFELIRFYPEGFLGPLTDIHMTSAWKTGQGRLAELLRAMRTELDVFGDGSAKDVEITIPWLLKNLPWAMWVALGTLLLTTLSLGISLGQTTFMREFLGK